MRSISIHFHPKDEAVAASLKAVLCLCGIPVASNRITGGVIYPAMDNARSVLVFSRHWDHTCLKNFLERMDPIVGQTAPAMVIVTLSRDDLGFVKYCETCGAAVTRTSNCLKNILVHYVPVQVRACRDSDPLEKAVHAAISHKVGAAYTNAKQRLAQILPMLANEQLKDTTPNQGKQ